MPTQVGECYIQQTSKKNIYVCGGCVYFKLFFPCVSLLKNVERVYFSHLISFGAITVALHIEFSQKHEHEHEHGKNHIHTKCQ